MTLSPRLQKLIDYLIDKIVTGATSLEIQSVCQTCAPGSDVADLRKHFKKHGIGMDVKCEYERMSDAGRRIFRYWLVVT